MAKRTTDEPRQDADKNRKGTMPATLQRWAYVTATSDSEVSWERDSPSTAIRQLVCPALGHGSSERLPRLDQRRPGTLTGLSPAPHALANVFWLSPNRTTASPTLGGARERRKPKNRVGQRRRVKLSRVDPQGETVTRNRFESTLSIQLNTQAIWKTHFPKAIVKTA